MSTAFPTIRLTSEQARKIAGSRTGGDFLIHSLACTQSKTAQPRNGSFYKSYREWSADVDVSRGTVNKYTKVLVDAGILVTWKEKDFTRIVGGIRTWYRVDVPALARLAGIKIKEAVQSGFDKAVDMAKEFAGQSDAKPMAVFVEHKEPDVQFCAKDFEECNPFFAGFAQRIEAAENAGKKPELVRLFRRFGFNCNYVKACLEQHLDIWRTHLKRQIDIDPEQKHWLEEDFENMDASAWMQACQVKPSVLNA